MLKLSPNSCMRIRSSVVGSSLRARTITVPSAPKHKFTVDKPPVQLSRFARPGVTLAANTLAVRTGVIRLIPLRHAHTDIKAPHKYWDKYRHDSLASATTRTNKAENSRKFRTGLLNFIGAVGGIYVTKAHTLHYIKFMDASADVLALARIEINVSEIPEGVTSTFKWRGKPIFVTHRTEEAIQRERAVPMSALRDPQQDSDRVQKPEWLVVIGICTHLGCVPMPNLGDFFGYYCPCHGAHYDGSGRVRKGPAPLNLAVPEYTFADDSTLVVG